MDNRNTQQIQQTENMTTPTNFFGAQQMSEYIMTNIFINKFNEIFSQNKKITLSFAMKLFLLMVLFEIKKCVPDFVNFMKPFMKKKIYDVINFIEYVKTKLNKHEKNEICKKKDCPIKNFNKIIKVKFSLILFEGLYNYAREKHYDELQMNSMSILNKKDHICTHVINDIDVDYDGELFTFIGEYIFSIDHKTGSLVDCKVNNYNNSPCDYTDLFDDEKKKYLNNRAQLCLQTYTTAEKYINGWFNMNNTHVGQIATKISMKYGFDKYHTCLIIHIICINHYEQTTRNIIKKNIEMLKNGKTLFDPDNSYDNIDNTGTLNADDELFHIYENSLCNLIGTRVEYMTPFKNFVSDEYELKSKEYKDDLASTIQLKCDKNIGKDKITNMISALCNKTKQNNNIDVNFLKLSIETNTKQENNPEYDEWCEKKKIVEKLGETSKEYVKFMLEPAPEQFIKKEDVTKKVTSKKINNINKKFETLYLRKADENKLLSCISQFRDKKDKLKDLGLQPKLNILLYGEPGTGKSTSIQAIATYLNKNIYYVDIKQAQTNGDLQMIFDHVNLNVSDGGIIVIEDIDAMTDVVLKRNAKNSENVAEIFNADKITLEYFLNVLQGTLTLDDSIFIVTTNHIDHLDPAFYRDGRFDTKIELKKCDKYQISRIYKNFMERELPDDILNLIPEDTYVPCEIIFHIKDYIFKTETADYEIMERFINKS